MGNLKAFDVQARGIASLAEDWELRHDEVRSVWEIEEVVEKLNACLRDAKQVFDDFRLGKLSDAGPFAYYVATFRQMVEAGRHIAAAAGANSQLGYQVVGSEELHRLLDDVQAIVDEDEFAQSSHSFE